MLIKTVQVKYAQNIACMRQNKIDAEFDSSSCLESRLHTAVNIVTVRAANVRNCVFGAAAEFHNLKLRPNRIRKKQSK